jgi:hypothetical protein
MQLYRFLDDPAQLIEDLSFIIAVATAENQPGRTAHVALIFLRPFDDLYIPGAVFHFRTSRRASRAALI